MLDLSCIHRSRKLGVAMGLVLLAGLMAVPPAAAQFNSGPPAVGSGAVTPGGGPPNGVETPEGFGNEYTYTAIHASRWTPWSETPVPSYYFATGYVGPTDSLWAGYWTQLDLPLGAEVDRVYAVVYDADTGGDWSFDFHGYEGAPFFGSPAYVSFAEGRTGIADAPGYTAIDLTLNPPVVIRQWNDISGDGTANVVSYNLSLEGTQTDGSDTLRFWGAVVRWRRTISPAPASATFTDVGPTDFGFKHVEALVASGITSGCTATEFCPNAPLTRVQMAVFLAKALGLHWKD